tara:strand:+ start:33 stop:290 length:258 start_codon:yes stop_codon:yes gene_type:complete
MLDLNSNNEWKKIDDNFEELIIDDIKFIREIGDKSLSLDCPICKKLISYVEDVERMKKENCCDDCYLNYYYINKEKWEKGWRPNR